MFELYIDQLLKTIVPVQYMYQSTLSVSVQEEGGTFHKNCSSHCASYYSELTGSVTRGSKVTICVKKYAREYVGAIFTSDVSLPTGEVSVATSRVAM